MRRWGIFNASVFINEHGHPPFLFQNFKSSHMINIQWTKFERKSIVNFISEELPQEPPPYILIKHKRCELYIC